MVIHPEGRDKATPIFHLKKIAGLHNSFSSEVIILFMERFGLMHNVL